MTTFITGAGLIGSHIARIVQERGEQPVLFDAAPQLSAIAEIVDLDRCTVVPGDILSAMELMDALRKARATRIIHTAAILTAPAQEDPYRSAQVNVVGTANVLEAARILGIQRVVFTSSLNVLLEGGGDKDPGLEEAFPRPSVPYAVHKEAAENIGLNYAQWYGVDFMVVRYGAVFGPWSGASSPGIPNNLVRGWVEASLAGQEAIIPDIPVPFVYVRDAAVGAYLAAQAKGTKSRVFNVAMPTLHRPDEIAGIVKRVIPTAKPKVVKRESGFASAASHRVIPINITRAREQLGFEPQYTFETALREFKDWLVSRY